ncbi:MAG: hypothetical protein A6F70_05865 [Cycloclasticus sp. symbiont of Bathymodiolus heckerae]|nr:MAG: hypothetical protein A6F70_05865 [Cycloclasticus sp. symbiont of Bathymodiolus heckerae]
MKILFITPDLSAKSDETEFFDGLHNVHGYKNTDVMGGHLLLELDNDSLGREMVLNLATLFDRWKINKSPLEALAQMVEDDSGH